MRRASLSLVRGLIATAAARSSSHCQVRFAAPLVSGARAPTGLSSHLHRFAAGLAARATPPRPSSPPAAAAEDGTPASKPRKRTASTSSSTRGTATSSTQRRKKDAGATAAAMDAPAAAPAAADGPVAAAPPKRARTPPPAAAAAAATDGAAAPEHPKDSKRQKPGGSDAPVAGSKKAAAAAGAAQRQAAGRVFAACKLGDAALALARFEELLAAGHRADGHLYNTMIHVCAGLWDWESLARARASERAKEQGAAASGVRGEEHFGGALPLVALIRVHQYEGGVGGGGGGGGGDGQQQQQQQQQEQRQQQQQQQQQQKQKPRQQQQADEPPPPPAPPLPPVPPEELARRADEFWTRMQAAGYPAEESTYTHLARIAAMRGDADAALAHARTVAASHRAALAGQRPPGGGRAMIARLRTYQPALLAYALRGDAAAARAIDAELQGLGIDLAEGELALLLEAAGRGEDAALAAEALHRMTHELARLSEPSAEVARRFFLSPAASASDALAAAPDCTADGDGSNNAADASAAANSSPLAGKRPRAWAVERTSAVDPATGACALAGGAARLVDLSDTDWDAFAAAVRALALKSAKAPDAFERFVEWEARHGPFDRCVDAANVALFGQNYAGGAFRLEQVRRVHAALAAADAARGGGGADGERQEPPGGRTLVVLHVRRKGEPSSRARDNAAWLDDLARERRFWWAPPGSNDDWYWLYASVRARGRGLLVTNDEMRDHVFQLLRPKHFLKWKERHVVRYDFGGAGAAQAPGGPATGGAPRLFFPRPFTACVQRVDATGAWMIPVAGAGGAAEGEEALAAEAAAGGAGEWIVARPLYD